RPPSPWCAGPGEWRARPGARLSPRTGRERLTLAFALLMLVMGVRILWRAPVGPTGPALAGGPFAGPVGVLTALALGAAVGLLAGYLGGGGGGVTGPAPTLLFGFRPQTPPGTSLAPIPRRPPFGSLGHPPLGTVRPRPL